MESTETTEYLIGRVKALWRDGEYDPSQRKYHEFGDVARELKKRGLDYKQILDPERKIRMLWHDTYGNPTS